MLDCCVSPEYFCQPVNLNDGEKGDTIGDNVINETENHTDRSDRKGKQGKGLVKNHVSNST